jgi:hypothetical protein
MPDESITVVVPILVSKINDAVEFGHRAELEADIGRLVFAAAQLQVLGERAPRIVEAPSDA